MKNNLLLILLCLFYSAVDAQTDFDLDPRESMIMTGKGPGQDGTINPYFGEDCIAIVENIGEHAFSIRVQEGETIIEEIPIAKGETKRVPLLGSYQLYLDPNRTAIAKARVDYEKKSESDGNSTDLVLEQYATMRVIEYGKTNSVISIVYEDGQTESIPLNDIGVAGLNLKKLQDNQSTVTQTLNEMAQKGYLLISESTSAFGPSNFKFTHYTFKKQ